VIEEGHDKGREKGKLPALEDMWELVPVSRNHSTAWGPEDGMPKFARAARRAWWFHMFGEVGGTSVGEINGGGGTAPAK
jgi:hypothetical protein